MTDDDYGDLNAILADTAALLGETEPPLVLATNAELLSVLEGQELIFAADNDALIRLRLYGPEELIEDRHQAISTRKELVTEHEQAIRLCEPLSLVLARKGWRKR